jgi:uncharacterized membrane protein YfcA
MLTYILVILTLFVAGILHGFSGFGSVLLSLPILSIFLGIKTVVPVVALAALSMTVILLIQLRPHISWPRIYPLILGAIPGILVGAFLLKRLDQHLLRLLLGTVLVGYAIYGLASAPHKKNIPDRWAYVFGFISGCLGGALSAVGPPIVAYVSLKDWNKDEIKATMQGFFLTSGILVVVVFALNRLITPTVLHLFGVSLPFVVLGTVLGSLYYSTVRDESYRKTLLVFLALLGVFTIYRAFV